MKFKYYNNDNFTAEFTVALTGNIGSGKSAAGNFFMQEKIFTSKLSFSSVTKEAVFHVANVGGKRIRFVDTPGLLNTADAEEIEIVGLAKAILEVPNGIHALCLVLDVTKRIFSQDEKALQQLLDYVELIPYSMVIFTHAKVLGNTEDDQTARLAQMLEDCPEILSKVLKSVNGRYMTLESIEAMEQGYHARKSQEFVEQLQTIFSQTGKPFTCILTDLARALLQTNDNLEVCIDALSNDIKITQKKMKDLETRSFWEKASLFITTGIGAGAGAVVGSALGPAGTVAGAAYGSSAVAAILASTTAAGSVVGGAVGTATHKFCKTQ